MAGSKTKADQPSGGGPDELSIVLVNPDEDFLSWATKHLAAKGLEIVPFSDAEKALPYCLNKGPDLTIAELNQVPHSGLDLLKQIRQKRPHSQVILTGAFPPSNIVIESMKWGAFEILGTESLNFELKPVVEAALQTCEAMRLGEAAAAAGKSPALGATDPGDTIIGRSPAMQEVFKMIGRVSRGDAPVLITGESGSGKEVVASAVHQFSLRSKRDYIAINCAAIPDNLLESELFGHEKGAFTGASTQRIGRFEQCDGGTLFLDEIGDMPIQTQSKILRVLQEGEFSRVGGNDTLRSDVRVLAATNKNLEREVEAGTFREDLFYRLNVVRIHIPPLRERAEDITLLADFFLKRSAEARKTQPLRLTAEAKSALGAYTWPGNVRELENTLQRAVALANTGVLLPRDLPLGEQQILGAENSQQSVAAAVSTVARLTRDEQELGLLAIVEREAVRHALASSPTDPTAAAAILGITEAALHELATLHGFSAS